MTVAGPNLALLDLSVDVHKSPAHRSCALLYSWMVEGFLQRLLIGSDVVEFSWPEVTVKHVPGILI